MTSPARPIDQRVERSLRWYRALLIAYPRSFRAEFGDDLVQGFRDLMMDRDDGPTTWWRVLRDLVVSAPRERVAAMTDPPRGGRPWVLAAAAVLVVSAAAVLGPSGPGFLVLVVPGLVLVVLPAAGVAQLWLAWRTHRTVGSGSRRHVLAGLACLLPAPVGIVTLSSLGGIGWYVFIGLAGGTIALAVIGITWAIMVLTQRRSAGGSRRSLAAKLVLAAGAFILIGIVGSSYNSYRKSLGPPGDHSVENASTDTRALWDAANRGDLDEVRRLTADTCADPWVKFPDENGRHNAKGQAEAGEFRLPGVADDVYQAVAEHLGDYMDVWADRCPTE